MPLTVFRLSHKFGVYGLLKRLASVANSETKLIFIKTNVYDTAFGDLNDRFPNSIDVRIPFHGQGGQKKFQVEFKKALDKAGYRK